MNERCKILGCGVLFLALSMLIACQRNRSTSNNATKPTTISKAVRPLSSEADTNALATIEAPDYEVKIYGAFSFVPDGDSAGLITPDADHKFVVFDVAVQNTSENRVVDMGQILLRARITDGAGQIYPNSPLAVRAFELAYPEPEHQLQYRSMRGKIRPGQYYRTTAFGIEAPLAAKDFAITLEEEGSLAGEAKMREAKFTID
jgi:hypothetical protein